MAEQSETGATPGEDLRQAGFGHGAKLAERAREQACKFGVEILLAREGVRAEFPPGKGVGYLGDGTQIVARASVCATGISYRRLRLPNEDRCSRPGMYGMAR